MSDPLESLISFREESDGRLTVHPAQPAQRFSFVQPATHGMRFRPGAFDNLLGQRVQLTAAAGTLWPSGSGTLVAAEVSPDGSKVMFTVDLDG